jgi:hypothetical protein
MRLLLQPLLRHLRFVPCCWQQRGRQRRSSLVPPARCKQYPAWERVCFRSNCGGPWPHLPIRTATATGNGRRLAEASARASVSAASAIHGAPLQRAARRDPQRAIYAACSATAAQMRCRTHLRSTFRRATAAWPDLPSAALHETSPKCKTHQHTSTQIRKTTPH